MPRSVFTYGSLMFERVWQRVVAGRYRRRPALLRGYRRLRVKGETYPALQRDDGAVVSGVLYLGVSDADLAALDAFEGADYRRIQVQVACLPEGGDGGDRAEQAGLQDADTYLFIADDKVEPRPWDPQRFADGEIDAFLRDYAPTGSRRD
jgi:gamma-glutamylcyclotransferase (GGCT)/AIG2-like uncharacterized protein YtfP